MKTQKGMKKTIKTALRMLTELTAVIISQYMSVRPLCHIL